MRLFSWLKKKQVQAETPDPIEETSSLATLGVQYRDYDEGAGERDLWDERIEDDQALKEPGVKFKAVFSNKTLTVFLTSGDIITNTNANKAMFLAVREAKTEGDIKVIMLADDLQEEDEKNLEEKLYDDEIQSLIPEIVATGDFTEVAGALYMNGIDVSIPKLLAKEIIKSGKGDDPTYYDSLKNFWCWCVLNPDSVAREDLFGFLERGDFKITKNGFFLGFRNVVKVEGKGNNKSAQITAFITDKYLNIKTKQKKSPKNFSVWQDDKGVLNILKNEHIPELIKSANVLGTLADLYNQLSDLEDNEYTDDYTRTMKIKIGTPVTMDRDKCDHNPYSDCSAGLHIKNKRYGDGSGNVAIVVAVNPMNVVAVPNHSANKMRVCEYMPLGVIEGPWEEWLEDVDTLALEDEYASDQIKNLHTLASSANTKEEKLIKLYGGKPIVDQVVKTLDNYTEEIKNRVVKVS